MSRILLSTELLSFGYVRENANINDDNYPFVLKQLICCFTQKTIKSKLLTLKMELDLLWTLNETIKLTEPKIIKLNSSTTFNTYNTLSVFHVNDETFAIYIAGGWGEAIKYTYDGKSKIFYFSREFNRISIRSSHDFNKKLKESIPVALKDMIKLKMAEIEVFHLVNYDPSVNQTYGQTYGTQMSTRTPDSETDYESDYESYYDIGYGVKRTYCQELYYL